MPKKIAINGFGRIGRLTLRNLLGRRGIEIVAINDLTDNDTLAHLFKYDSAQGEYPGKVTATENTINIGRKKIISLSERDPSKLPWRKLKVDVVLECTGVFRTKEKASLHLSAGAKKVILSAPAKSEGIQTIVLGVNDELLDPKQKLYSNASCTTNCLAPVVKIIDENWGFVQGSMTTTHAYTSDQRIQDAPHSDLRRARAAAFNIVPTSTGAASAVGKVYPSVAGKLDAMAIRVPVITGSLIEVNALVEKAPTVEAVNRKFKSMARTKYNGILEYQDVPLVSSDIVGNPYSSIFDSQLTKVNGNMIKVVSWYDNEAGYSARMADLTVKVASLAPARKRTARKPRAKVATAKATAAKATTSATTKRVASEAKAPASGNGTASASNGAAKKSTRTKTTRTKAATTATKTTKAPAKPKGRPRKVASEAKAPAKGNAAASATNGTAKKSTPAKSTRTKTTRTKAATTATKTTKATAKPKGRPRKVASEAKAPAKGNATASTTNATTKKSTRTKTTRTKAATTATKTKKAPAKPKGRPRKVASEAKAPAKGNDAANATNGTAKKSTPAKSTRTKTTRTKAATTATKTTKAPAKPKGRPRKVASTKTEPKAKA